MGIQPRRRAATATAPRLLAWLALASACSACDERQAEGITVTFPGSAVGAEGEVLARQLQRFMRANPDIRVVQRRTPDAANQRHQLYVQWLNARASDPDVLQLDVIWTPEFAAAEWLLPLDRFAPDTRDLFAPAVRANRYRGKLYALPWFVDVGMLYYRSDLLDEAPRRYSELVRQAERAGELGLEHGLVWQGARYEGLVTVFVEYLSAFGGRILDDAGRVTLDSPPARAALGAMARAIREEGIVPRAALTWHEEQTRFAFQNGHALFMRNWPYAYALMQDPQSKVAGRFRVAPMPPAEGGRASAALGGSQLAINKHSDHPEAAYRVIEFLTRPRQMIERAEVAGQLPPRRSLYRSEVLKQALPMPAGAVEDIIARAVARPVTPVYSQLSEILQIELHRCLSGQKSTGAALSHAQRDMQALLSRVKLLPSRGPHREDGHAK